MAVLEAVNLKCGYGEFEINVNRITVKPGTFTAVVGPNGAGKTTLIKALGRVLKPKQGQVLLEGKDIWSMKPKDFSKKVAVVPQDVPNVPLKTREFVLLGRIPYHKRFQLKETRRDIEAAQMALKMVDIEHLSEKSLSFLSGGERQLAAIAKALAQEPEILMLDEPVSHLDISRQLKILELLIKLKRNNIAIIAVLHELNIASEFCDIIILMKKGMVVYQGTPHQVLEPDILKEVYGVDLLVEKHPVSSRPHVMITRSTPP